MVEVVVFMILPSVTFTSLSNNFGSSICSMMVAIFFHFLSLLLTPSLVSMHSLLLAISISSCSSFLVALLCITEIYSPILRSISTSPFLHSLFIFHSRCFLHSQLSFHYVFPNPSLLRSCLIHCQHKPKDYLYMVYYRGPPEASFLLSFLGFLNIFAIFLGIFLLKLSCIVPTCYLP